MKLLRLSHRQNVAHYIIHDLDGACATLCGAKFRVWRAYNHDHHTTVCRLCEHSEAREYRLSRGPSRSASDGEKGYGSLTTSPTLVKSDEEEIR